MIWNAKAVNRGSKCNPGSQPFWFEKSRPVVQRKSLSSNPVVAQTCWSPTSHEIDSSDGADFIVMELVDGAPLDGLVPKGGLPLPWVWLRANCFRASASASRHCCTTRKAARPRQYDRSGVPSGVAMALRGFTMPVARTII